MGYIKSIVSTKLSGRVFNMLLIREIIELLQLHHLQTPTKANISVNQDGTLSNEGKARVQNQQFVLERVTNAQQYRSLIGENSNAGADVSSSCNLHPIYIIKSNALGKQSPPLVFRI